MTSKHEVIGQTLPREVAMDTEQTKVHTEAKPYAFTPYLQASVAVASLMIGISAMVATFNVWRTERNARLVEIGVAVLRADPKKDASAARAREWALDLIDANAGVKFSPSARRELLEQALAVKPIGRSQPDDFYSVTLPTFRDAPPRAKTSN